MDEGPSSQGWAAFHLQRKAEGEADGLVAPAGPSMQTRAAWPPRSLLYSVLAFQDGPLCSSAECQRQRPPPCTGANGKPVLPY